MELQTVIGQLVSDQVNSFIAQVAKKHNISETDLQNIWESIPETEKSTGKKVEKKVEKISSDDPFNLSTMTLKQLKGFVHEQNLTGVKLSAKKEQLLESIRNALNSKEAGESKPAKTGKKLDPHPAITRYMGLMKNSFLTVVPWKNSNLLHEESGIVLSKTTQRAIGTVGNDGKLQILTPDDIELCKKHKIQYDVPGDLDKGRTDQESIEELDEEDELNEIELVGSDEELICESDEEEVEFEN